MFEFEAFGNLQISHPALGGMTDLKVKNNEEIGHYRQTLITDNKTIKIVEFLKIKPIRSI